MSADLKWNHHVDYILARARRILGVLRKLRSFLSVEASVTFCKSYIRLILEYADIVWSVLCKIQADRLERFQLRACWIILRLPQFAHTSHSHLLKILNLHTLSSRHSYRLAFLLYKISHCLAQKKKGKNTSLSWNNVHNLLHSGAHNHSTHPYSELLYISTIPF